MDERKFLKLKLKTIIATCLAVLSSTTMAFANTSVSNATMFEHFPMYDEAVSYGPGEAEVESETINAESVTMDKESETLDMFSPLGPSLGMFRLTAYCTGHCCNGKWGNITALGTKITPRKTIAVDPRVIPLGTWVYINIPGQGWQKFLAEDTGGGVKGNHIDISVQNHYESFTPAYNGYAEVRIALA